MITASASNRVGLVESNPKLAERYNLCGAAALVTISENKTIPFRIINPTSQPVTLYRRTNLGQISLYQQPPVVSVIDTNQAELSSTSQSAHICFDLSHTDLNDEQQAQLNKLLEANSDVFAATDHELGHTSLVQHHIDTGDAQPIFQQPYRVSPSVRNRINEHVDKMLEQPSISPYGRHQ